MELRETPSMYIGGVEGNSSDVHKMSFDQLF
jgi:hypothetical protein